MADLNGRKVAVLVTDGFEQIELTEPVAALRDAGAETRIIAPRHGRIKAWNRKDWGDEFDVDVPLDDARADEYDALLLPGGVMSPDKLRMQERAVASCAASSMTVARSRRSVTAPGCSSRPTSCATAPSRRTRRCAPTSRTPARTGSTRRSSSTTVWSRAASPTICRPSIARWSRNSPKAATNRSVPGGRRAVAPCSARAETGTGTGGPRVGAARPGTGRGLRSVRRPTPMPGSRLIRIFRLFPTRRRAAPDHSAPATL
jgi:hypothetical protein